MFFVEVSDGVKVAVYDYKKHNGISPLDRKSTRLNSSHCD